MRTRSKIRENVIVLKIMVPFVLSPSKGEHLLRRGGGGLSETPRSNHAVSALSSFFDSTLLSAVRTQVPLRGLQSPLQSKASAEAGSKCTLRFHRIDASRCAIPNRQCGQCNTNHRSIAECKPRNSCCVLWLPNRSANNYVTIIRIPSTGSGRTDLEDQPSSQNPFMLRLSKHS